MSQKQTVTLTIMGKEYKIACEAEERESLLRSAQQLDEQMRRMRDSGKISGPDRIAVMAALNLSHELEITKKQNELLAKQLDTHVNLLKNKLENVLENP